MEITSEQALRINEFVKNYPEDEIEKWPLEIGGEKAKLKYYRFPINLLRYNVNNGRLAMEVGQWELENGRKLDTNLIENSRIIRNLLLGLDENKTKELRIDLLKIGQLEPGVITHDGVVINGNRRLAIMEDLHENVDASGKWQNLDAILLPPNVSQPDLWKIEAGLQLSKDKVAEYHPVNELLKIRQGIQAGLKPNEIQAAIYGRTIEDIEDSIDRLKLIDNFLLFFDKGQKNNYGLIKKFGLHEYFINIQKNIVSRSKKSGVGTKERAKQLEYAFALIRAHVIAQSNPDVKGISHFDIRQLGKIYQTSKAYLAFEETFTGANSVKNVNPELVLEGYRNAKEVLDLEAEKNKPKKFNWNCYKSIG